MANTRKCFVLLLLPVVWALLQNGQQGLASGAQHPKPLIVCRHATNVRFRKRGPSDQLTYHVSANFPASAVIDQISRKLGETGWKPLANDFLNPRSSSSLMRSWHTQLAGLKKPWTCFRLWIGDWKDPSGNIVRYAFRYKELCTSHASTDLEVIAVYIPKAAVRQLEEAIKKYPKT